MVLELLTSSGFGALVGVRHALEPDHFAAVATLVGSERTSLRAALLGMYWGVGHTLAIVAACVALALLQAEMPASVLGGVNLVVSAMLLALGFRAMGQALRSPSNSTAPLYPPARATCRHVGVRKPVSHATWTLALRPLLVGAVHGLAGSGALTALVLTTLPSRPSQILYLACFGVGSTLSMAGMSGLLGWPLTRLGTHHVVARSITFVVGFGSAALGLMWANTSLRWL